MNDKNEGRFDDSDPNSGWVQFDGAQIAADYGAPATVIYGTSVSQIVLPVEVNVPINSNGTEVSYTINDISGNSTSIIPVRSGVVSIFKNDVGEVLLRDNLVIDINNAGTLTSTAEFNITLTGTNRPNVSVGLSDASIPTVIRFRVCLFNVGLNYNATAVASTGFAGPEFVQTLVPVVGTTNQFTVATVWGTTFFPCFIGNCNNVAAIRRWPAIFTINDNFTVTVTGNDPAFPNRYPTSLGTYDPCTDTFNIPALNQAVLTSNQFTTNVTYTPIP